MAETDDPMEETLKVWKKDFLKNFSINVSFYRDEGMSDKEARIQVLKDFYNQGRFFVSNKGADLKLSDLLPFMERNGGMINSQVISFNDVE